jgi:hypothetical protein
MNLENIHGNYNTDKGTRHNYITTYENIFRSFRIEKLSILEIGILDGGSLKMWNDYFVNSTIYGIDNFSQEWIGGGFMSQNFRGKFSIVEDLTKYSNRLKIIDGDSRSISLTNEFDVIIDDGDHNTIPIINTFDNLFKYLKVNGLYIIEDPISLFEAAKISEYILLNYSNVELEIKPFNIKNINDDILILVRKIS